MQEDRQLTTGDYSLLAVFFASIILSLLPVITGLYSVEMSPEHMAFVLSFLAPLAAMMAGIILTYSMAQYTLLRRFRHLVLVFLAINMIITSVLYLVTNESMAAISPFAGKERNRTIVTAFTFVLTPSVLFAGVGEQLDLGKKGMVAAIVWGGILAPLVSLWFLLSPEPVFLTTITGDELTSTAAAIVAIIAVVFSVAIWRYYTAWRAERNRLDLAAILSIVLWSYSIGLFVLQSGPLQFMEIIWFSVFVCGEMLIAAVTISKEVIEPQKTLATLVDQRTQELKESKTETEFYLNIWGHKIGNLLQSMMLYLEMFSLGSKEPAELVKLADTALVIGDEANQINRQVAALIRLKQHQDYELVPVSLKDTIETALATIAGRHGPDCIVEATDLPVGEVCVYADEFAELAIVNLLSFLCKQYPQTDIALRSDIRDDSVCITARFPTPRLSEDIEESLFSRLRPARTTLSLDLFTVKILMARFGGDFCYSWDETSKTNEFALTFIRTKARLRESGATKETLTTEQ